MPHIAALEASVTAARNAGPIWILARSLNSLGVIARYRGAFEQARSLTEEALALRRQIGDTWGIATSLSDLGHLDRALGDDDSARCYYEQSLEMRRRLQDPFGIFACLTHLGAIALACGQIAQARAFLEDATAVSRSTGLGNSSAGYVGYLQPMLAIAFAEQSDYQQASNVLDAALRAAMQQDAPVGQVLTSCAWLAAVRRHWRAALRLAGAATSYQPRAYNHLNRSRVPPADRAALDRRLQPARDALGAEAAAAAWAEGAAMSSEEAVQCALAVIEDARHPDRSDNRPREVRDAPSHEALTYTATNSTPLSPREREVAALLAQGLTNRQIAAQLIISEHTAKRHVEHILNKLGFSTRSQVAAWAVTQGVAGPT